MKLTEDERTSPSIEVGEENAKRHKVEKYMESDL